MSSFLEGTTASLRLKLSLSSSVKKTLTLVQKGISKLKLARSARHNARFHRDVSRAVKDEELADQTQRRSSITREFENWRILNNYHKSSINLLPYDFLFNFEE